MENNVQDRIKHFNGEGGMVQEGLAPGSNLVKKEEEYRIKVKPIAFESTIDATSLTTIDIASQINAMFRGVYRDYEGCTLSLDTFTNRWKATIYFCENANATKEGTVANIEPLSSKAKSNASMEQRIGSVSSLLSNVHYKLTKETEESLSKYFMPHEKNKKTGQPNWRVLMGETREQVGYGYNNSAIYVIVNGLDVLSLLKDIYGWQNEEGHNVDYWLQAVRPITQYIQSTPNMLFTLQRVDCMKVEAMLSKIGAVPAMGRLQIIKQ